MIVAALIRAASLGSALRRRVWRLSPLVALVATGGCFATRNDVRIVQTDVASLRGEMLKNDAALRDQLTQAIKMLAVANDSLSRISARTVGTQGDVRGEMRAVRDQLSQVQTLVMQLQGSITRFRSDIEERTNAAPPVAPPVQTGAAGSTPVTQPVTNPPANPKAPGTAPTTGNLAGGTPPTVDSAVTAAPRGPGATTLYTDAQAQLRRGSRATARTLFQELLSNYPGSDLAPDAQQGIALSYEAEKNYAAADAAFGAVVSKYPDSRVAPTALFKQGIIALQQGNKAGARKFFTDVVSRYPKSDEAELAAEQLKSLR